MRRNCSRQEAERRRGWDRLEAAAAAAAAAVLLLLLLLLLAEVPLIVH